MVTKRERDAIVTDLADGVLRVRYVNMVVPGRGRMPNMWCEACYTPGVTGYQVWVEHPSPVLDEEDTWNHWGFVCFDCMCLIVGAGGTPLRWNRSEA